MVSLINSTKHLKGELTPILFSSSHVWMWELDYKESWVPNNWCFWTVVLEKTLESLGLQEDSTSQSKRKSVLNIQWKDWCWSWNSNTLATWCKELTPWKRPWCWERLMVGRERDDRGWDGWMASPTRWTWVWASSGSWWWTGRPNVLQSMGSQRVRHEWVTELNWLNTRTSQTKCQRGESTSQLLYELSIIQTKILQEKETTDLWI